MCSACAGDDPRPEMYASFDVSSPGAPMNFAFQERKRQKRYGTRAGIANGATVLRILRRRAKTWVLRSFRPIREKRFVNLRALGFLQIEGAIPLEQFIAARAPLHSSGAPIDIRVTRDAIIEVYGAPGATDAIGQSEAQFGDGQRAGADAAAVEWDASDLARHAEGHHSSRDGPRDPQSENEMYVRRHRAQAVVAYVGFVLLVAFVMWYAIR